LISDVESGEDGLEMRELELEDLIGFFLNPDVIMSVMVGM
jgi:hypothetical protein